MFMVIVFFSVIVVCDFHFSLFRVYQFTAPNASFFLSGYIIIPLALVRGEEIFHS